MHLCQIFFYNSWFNNQVNMTSEIKVMNSTKNRSDVLVTYGPQCHKVSKGAKIRNRYNQVPHLTQDTNGKVINSQLDTTNESQEVSPFPAGDHKAHIYRHSQRHSKHKTEKKHKRSTKPVFGFPTKRDKPVSTASENS